MKIKTCINLGLIGGEEARGIVSIFGECNFEQRNKYDEYYLKVKECELTFEQIIKISDYFKVEIIDGIASIN